MNTQGAYRISALVILVALSAVGFLPKAAHAITWTSAVDDDFHRANTSVGGAGSTSGAGNSWIDVQGNVFNISSNKLIGTPEVSADAYLRDFLIRPVSENRLNQKMIVTTGVETGSPSIWNTALRYQTSSKNTYFVLLRDSGSMVIYSDVGSVLSTLASYSFSFNAAHTYRVTSTVVGISPATITAVLEDVTAATTLTTLTATDSSGSLQGSGAFGVNVHADATNGISIPFTRVQTFYDSTSLDIGVPSLTAIGTSTATVSSSVATGGTAPYTYQWKRSTVSGGSSYVTIAGATGLSVDDTGLIPNEDYYYILTIRDSSGITATSSEVHAKTDATYSATFTDSFDGLTNGNINGQNGWTRGGNGTWTIGSGGTGTKIVTQTDSGPNNYYLNYISNGSSTWTNQKLKVDFNTQSTTYAPQFWLRKSAASGDVGGYLIFYNSADGWTIANYQTGVAGSYVLLANTPAPFTVNTNTWYTAEVEVVNNSIGRPVINVYAYTQGGTRSVEPILSYTDTAHLFSSGRIALGVLSNVISYDNVIVSYDDSTALAITAPTHALMAAPNTATRSIIDEGGVFYIPYIQTSTTLTTSATVSGSYLPSGGGIKFVLNEGLSGEQTQYSVGGSSPFSVNFTGLAKGTYTLDTYVVDSSRAVQSGSINHKRLTSIGIGDIITGLGDSITAGYPYTFNAVTDWTQASGFGDPVSSDNRNFAQMDPASGYYRIGYSVELNNALSSYYGYPVFFMNEGWSGYTASDYIFLIAGSQWRTRQLDLAPSKFLVHLGVNDADSAVTAATYRTNMQSIVNSLVRTIGVASSSVYVAKPLYINFDAPSLAVEQTYLPKIDDLVSANLLSTGPDFYDYYAPYSSTLYADSIHPNTAGYTQMASLWGLPLIKPLNVAAALSNGTITLTWDNLATYNSQINGYRVAYGNAPGVYTTTVDVGNVRTLDVSNLTLGRTYYFGVVGYYSDSGSSTVSPTATSTEVSIEVPDPSAHTTTAAPAFYGGGWGGAGGGAPSSFTNTNTLALALAAMKHDLFLGVRSDDVKTLQQYLNTHGFIVAASGSGSPGHETNYFGALTKAALAKFQKAHGISPAAGYFGPLTRAYIRTH